MAGLLCGIKPAVTTVVVFAAYRIGSRALKNGASWAIAAAAFVAIFALKQPFRLIMIVACVGFVGGWAKQLFRPDTLFAAGVAAACVATLLK